VIAHSNIQVVIDRCINTELNEFRHDMRMSLTKNFVGFYKNKFKVSFSGRQLKKCVFIHDSGVETDF
jgi:hypothetical protein